MEEQSAPCFTFNTSILPSSASGFSSSTSDTRITRIVILFYQTILSFMNVSSNEYAGLLKTSGVEDCLFYLDKLYLTGNSVTNIALQESRFEPLGGPVVTQYTSDTSTVR